MKTMSGKIVIIDDIKWWVTEESGRRIVTPLCPDHDLRMTAKPGYEMYLSNRVAKHPDTAFTLECAEGPHNFTLPRSYGDEKTYVINRIDAKIFKGMQVINLDGELTPIAKDKIKDDKYFVTAQLMESKRGIQLAVYAGEKGKDGKTQIFVEPEIKRLAFDQKDLHPNEVFIELKATFKDGSSHMIASGDIENE